MLGPPDAPRIRLLADHPDLIAEVGALRWREWGYADPDPGLWISVTAGEAGRDRLPVTLVAVGPDGDATGAVALGDADGELNETERRGRSPWLLGLVVRADARRQGVGRLLVSALERLAAERGHRRVWVATGGEAVHFYQRCRWVEVESLVLAAASTTTTILTRRLSALGGHC